jgi:hypothetical protein
MKPIYIVLAVACLVILGWVAAAHIFSQAQASNTTSSTNLKALCDQEGANQGVQWQSYNLVYVSGKATGVDCVFPDITVYVQFSQ